MNSKPLIFVVISVFVVALVYTPSAVFDLNASPKIGGTFNAPPIDEGTASPETGGVFNAPQTDEGAAGEPPAEEGTASKGRNMTPSTCTKIPDGGTIGEVYCCATDLDTAIDWCTTCDATNPPSNCGPPEQQFLTKGGGTFEAQPFNKTFTPQGGGGVFEAQPFNKTFTPQGGGGTFESGGTFNALQPPQEGAAGVPPPTEEGTQPPTLTEEPAPPVCLEGQVLDEQTNLCVLEEPEAADEGSEQSEPEGQEQTEEGDGSEGSNNDND